MLERALLALSSIRIQQSCGGRPKGLNIGHWKPGIPRNVMEVDKAVVLAGTPFDVTLTVERNGPLAPLEAMVRAVTPVLTAEYLKLKDFNRFNKETTRLEDFIVQQKLYFRAKNWTEADNDKKIKYAQIQLRETVKKWITPIIEYITPEEWYEWKEFDRGLQIQF
ncbi:hypothetical protein HOY80DRAFT_1028996 [Tuber brumale]|nr:hypothetical protein HOY80DRAFT_1028996 [Tuber brumale]